MTANWLIWALLVWLICAYGFSAWHIWKLYGYLRKQAELIESYDGIRRDGALAAWARNNDLRKKIEKLTGELDALQREVCRMVGTKYDLEDLKHRVIELEGKNDK